MAGDTVPHTNCIVLKERIPNPHIERVKIPQPYSGIIIDELIAQHRGLGAASRVAATQGDKGGIFEHVIGILIAGIEIIHRSWPILVYKNSCIILAVEG